MNSESLKAKINNRAKKNQAMPQDLMQMYFFERLLYRISISKYKNNFILKGGLLLSSLFGDGRRTTQDMDTMIKGIEIKSEKLNHILEEIINLDGNDDIEFKILKTNDIRIQDKYGGTRISILGVKEELQVNLKIDITTKDPIAPREINFKYKSMFDDTYINIVVFTKESIIAKKFQTLIEDNVISNSDILKSYWNNFIKSHVYASEISYNTIINKIEEIVNSTVDITV